MELNAELIGRIAVADKQLYTPDRKSPDDTEVEFKFQTIAQIEQDIAAIDTGLEALLGLRPI